MQETRPINDSYYNILLYLTYVDEPQVQEAADVYIVVFKQEATAQESKKKFTRTFFVKLLCL